MLVRSFDPTALATNGACSLSRVLTARVLPGLPVELSYGSISQGNVLWRDRNVSDEMIVGITGAAVFDTGEAVYTVRSGGAVYLPVGGKYGLRAVESARFDFFSISWHSTATRSGDSGQGVAIRSFDRDRMSWA